jgi:rhodanese-related sulfurtransferase
MINEMSAIELQKQLATNKNLILIDCREETEWNEAHIEQATLIPLSVFENEFKKTLTNPEAEIAIICRSGRRSMNACLFLNDLGFANLYNIEGGILAWIEKGFKVV